MSVTSMCYMEILLLKHFPSFTQLWMGWMARLWSETIFSIWIVVYYFTSVHLFINIDTLVFPILGNFKWCWFSIVRLPVLAGAAGALGATYCSPYFAVDGAYNARPSGQISSLTTAPRSVFSPPFQDIPVSLVFFFVLACAYHTCSTCFFHSFANTSCSCLVLLNGDIATFCSAMTYSWYVNSDSMMECQDKCDPYFSLEEKLVLVA